MSAVSAEAKPWLAVDVWNLRVGDQVRERGRDIVLTVHHIDPECSVGLGAGIVGNSGLLEIPDHGYAPLPASGVLAAGRVQFEAPGERYRREHLFLLPTYGFCVE